MMAKEFFLSSRTIRLWRNPVDLSNAPRVALIDAKSVTAFEVNVDMTLSHYIEEVVEPVEPGLDVVKVATSRIVDVNNLSARNSWFFDCCIEWVFL